MTLGGSEKDDLSGGLFLATRKDDLFGSLFLVERIATLPVRLVLLGIDLIFDANSIGEFF